MFFRAHFQRPLLAHAMSLNPQWILVHGNHLGIRYNRQSLRLHLRQVIPGQQRRGENAPQTIRLGEL